MVFAARRSSFYDNPPSSVVGLLDSDRQLQWMQLIDGFAWRDPSSHADRGSVTDLALGPDGDIVVLAYYSEEVGGPSNPSPGHPKSYVFERGLDGSERWTSFFAEGVANHLLVTPSGNLVVAGSDDDVYLLPNSSLPYKLRRAPSAAALDAAGRGTGLHWVELPTALLGPNTRVTVKDVTMAGEALVMAGSYSENDELAGYVVTASHRDGSVAWERIFPVRDASADVPSGPTAAEVAPDGRIALGGNLTGFVDFGDGETGGGEDPVPFIAVFEPPGTEVDG